MFDPNFFVLISTLLFIALVFKPAKKGLNNFLDDRATKIKTQIDEAAKLKAEANDALTRAQEKERSIEQQTKLILEQAKAEIMNLQNEAKTHLEETLRRKEQAAFTRIASIEREATQLVQNMVADVTLAAVRKVLKDHLPQEVAHKLVAGAIDSLPQDLQRKTVH